jgi:DNA-binding GntR family transcriptional regulator
MSGQEASSGKSRNEAGVSTTGQTLQLDLPPDSSGYRTKADWAYLQLRRWIQSGVLEAEQRLDQEELAARLGVSRVPLRQALVRLQAEGLIIGRPHVGAKVAPLTLAHAEDIYAGRGALEPMLAKAAALRLNEETIRDLNRLLDEQQWALEEGDRTLFLELDRRFHRRLYEESGYHTSLELVQRLRDLSDRYVARFQGDPERSRSTLLEHREIVRACASGDATQAARLVREHVQHGIEFLRQASRTTETAASR